MMMVLFMKMVVVLLLQFKIHNKDRILFVIADALRERFNANKNVLRGSPDINVCCCASVTILSAPNCGNLENIVEVFESSKEPPVDESDSNDTDESDSLMILKILIIGYIHHCVVGFACL
uniref:Uncharacterized protein n=1 Tax=Helianthus annuus TaxID=4232 RepID=A0A251T8F8_HELAN